MMPTGEPNVARSRVSFCGCVLRRVDFFSKVSSLSCGDQGMGWAGWWCYWDQSACYIQYLMYTIKAPCPLVLTLDSQALA
jgi:hypothetical protein